MLINSTEVSRFLKLFGGCIEALGDQNGEPQKLRFVSGCHRLHLSDINTDFKLD